MKRAICVLIAMLLLGAAALAEGEGNLTVVTCAEQDFASRVSANIGSEWVDDDGLYVYTQSEGSIPYVLIYRADSGPLNLQRYFKDIFTPYMRDRYGSDLVGILEYESYPLAGWEMTGVKYTYLVEGHIVDLLRVGGMWDDVPVFFGAKYLQGKDEETLAALEELVANFQPDAHYYDE